MEMMEIEQDVEAKNTLKISHAPYAIKSDEYNFLKMMQNNDKKYNKIRKMNKQQLSYNSKNPRQKEINEQIEHLYDEIDKEFNSLKSNASNASSPCFKHKIVKIDKDSRVIQQSLLKSSYIPPKIGKYIKEQSKIVLEYSCNLDNGRTVKINFILFNKSEYELNNIRKKSASYFKNCVLKIYIWLKILSKYSSIDCGKNLECFIYLTHFKRKLPNTNDYDDDDDGESEDDGRDDEGIYNAGAARRYEKVFTPDHVNGGLSDVCQINGQIIVYRREEWFKVFIHETMHNYGLDFSNLDLSIANKKLQSVFSIQTNVKIFESYCEFWARVMNVLFESYFEMNRHSLMFFTPLTTRKRVLNKLHKYHFVSMKRGSQSRLHTNTVDSRERFLNIFYDNLQHESVFSMFQCVKILNFMGLDYNIISNCNNENYITVKKLYKEKTNVFAYYIIVAILIANFNNFILWCIDNNTNLFNFKKNNSAIESFIMFIYKNYKNSDLLNMVISLENKLGNRNPNDEILLNTMRMTVIGGNR